MTTTSPEVFHRDTHGAAGVVTMTVDGDAFTSASAEHPLYIQILLESKARLGDTRVRLSDSNKAVNQPIHLPMVLNSSHVGDVVAAPPETVSIVRWVSGEKSIWLRVQTGSDDWIANGDAFFGPGTDRLVSWTLGVSARIGMSMGRALGDRTNLLAATRSLPGARDAMDEGDAVSTSLCVHLGDSQLTTEGEEARLRFTPTVFTDSVVIGNGNYSTQNAVSIDAGFTGNTQIASGRAASCQVTPFAGLHSGSSVADLPQGTRGGSEITLNRLSLEVECGEDGSVPEHLFDGSRLRLSTPDRVPYGFAAGSVFFSGAAPGYLEYEESSQFELDGQTLYRTVDLVWDGGARPADRLLLEIVAALTFEPNPVYRNLNVAWELFLVNHEGGRDEAPFDGDDQFIRCLPEEYSVGSGNWLHSAGAQNSPIQRQPTANTMACAGDAVSLTIAASGSSLNYQWYKDGSAIEGARDARLDLVMDADSEGVYTCRVTGFNGAFFSEPAYVSLSDFAATLNFRSRTQGLKAVLARAVPFCGRPPYTYAWEDSSGAFMADTFVFAIPWQTQVETFTLRITDADGKEIRTAVTVLGTPNTFMLDPNYDGKNTVEDLFLTASIWQLDSGLDADGDRKITVLDMLFVDTGTFD
ncbi:MAG: immunoglobulin domain-containing protein [Acidobacteriota bacterium]|nr:immunoglobulin domain-containing protein [Acidobacteriota bacterium]